MKPEFTALTGTYDLRLLALSVILAALTSYAGFEVVERARAACARARTAWIAIGGAAFGVGLCGATDIAIGVFQPSIPIRYHYPTMLLALLAAIAAATMGVFAATQEYNNLPRPLVISGVTAATGTAIPYLGLRSFRMAAETQFRWDLLGASAVVAFLIFLLVLVLDVGVHRSRRRSPWNRIGTSAAVGAAIVLWALGALHTVRFRPVTAEFEVARTFARSFAVLAGIAGTTLLMVSGTILITTLSRLFSAREELFAKAHERESFFNNLAEAIPGIVWIADDKGQTTYINRHWYEMTGADPNRSLGSGWMESVHPDDREPMSAKWELSRQLGETFEIEYRLLDAKKGYRWYLDRAVPVRDENQVIRQWFGTCTDIEEQKHYQQSLEQQIKERTEELADANTRSQQEMWEKDLARRTLDEHNEQMMQALKERSQRATLLATIGELLQSCHTREEVFAAALGFAPKVFPSRRGAIALFNASHNLVEVAGHWRECQISSSSFEPESCWALRTGHPHLVLAGDNTARCTHATGVESTYLCVPILAQGEALGILHIQATDQDPNLGEAEMSFNTTFAAQIGLSVANIRLREALRAQSTKDPLTGLYNRRYLQEMLEREIRRAIRSEQALGVLMLDLDHFKNFNDTYGHEAGDTVVRETGAFLVRRIRAEDFVCRYGGEEFVVILPTADIRAAAARAERIRSKIRDLVVMHDGRSLGLVTVSIGVAALPTHGTNEKDLLQAADAVLYRAKREGRDRVVAANPVVTAQQESSVIGTGT